MKKKLIGEQILEQDVKAYRRAVMGGSFDRLHDAHRMLISTAARIAEEVFVGIVGEELGQRLFSRKKYAEIIQPYNIRYEELVNYTSTLPAKIEVGELTDPWGPAPDDKNADVIIVSHETRQAAETINKMRTDKGLTPLDIVVVPWIWTQEGKLLSSTLLREREVESNESL